jgi:hypothetical protein
MWNHFLLWLCKTREYILHNLSIPSRPDPTAFCNNYRSTSDLYVFLADHLLYGMTPRCGYMEESILHCLRREYTALPFHPVAASTDLTSHVTLLLSLMCIMYFL